MEKKYKIRIGLMEATFMVCSILFVKPSWMDETVEKMLRPEMAGPIELVYKWLSGVTGIAPAVFVYGVLPWLLLPIFYVAYHWMAKCLFRGSNQGMTPQEAWFLAAVYIFFMLQVLMDGYVGLGVYRNIWNGTTLFVSVLVPCLVVSICRLLRRG